MLNDGGCDKKNSPFLSPPYYHYPTFSTYAYDDDRAARRKAAEGKKRKTEEEELAGKKG